MAASLTRDSLGRFAKSGAGGIIITSDTLTPGLTQFPPKVDLQVHKTIDFFRPRAEGYARQNAPWTDRTGNARNGLRATAIHVPLFRHSLVVSHSVPYGIWLEVRFEGKFAIIEPTIEKQGKDIMTALRGILRRA